MIIVGLLIVALVCLALGLILPSTAWLIASLIASVGAGYVLFRARTLIAGAHAVEGAGGGGASAATSAATSVLEREPAPEPETQPRRTRAQSRAEARAAKAAAAAELAESDVDEVETSDLPAADEAPTTLLEPVRADDTVEVSGAELLAGVSSDSTSDSTSDSNSDSEHAGGSAEPATTEPPQDVVEANEGDVWVIDGRPRYHLATCAIIQGQDAEPIPFEQATEDGFMPCSLCEPNVVRATA